MTISGGVYAKRRPITGRQRAHYYTQVSPQGGAAVDVRFENYLVPTLRETNSFVI